MKSSKIFLSSMLFLFSSVIFGDNSIYYNELKALKKAPQTKILFDQEAHAGLSAIQRDITIYKELTSFQRFVRTAFLMCDVIIVTSDNMPLLYGYIQDICKKADIAMPTVFITRQKGFFNAFAQKLLVSTGGIIVGQQLLREVSGAELEAVVAHEIGHIKYNHVNKMLGLFVFQCGFYMALCNVLGTTISKNAAGTDIIKVICKCILAFNISELLPALIINKRFEKEADFFACECSRAEGLIKFFERLEQKWQSREGGFDITYNLLEQNKAALGSDYYGLVWRYYVAKVDHAITRAFRDLYHNTFWGAHPSNQARIDAAYEYLQNKI